MDIDTTNVFPKDVIGFDLAAYIRKSQENHRKIKKNFLRGGRINDIALYVRAGKG